MSLSDEEIALVKALLQTKNFTNDQIRDFFTTAYTTLNSGRISEIKTGKKHADIPPASSDQLKEFILQKGLQLKKTKSVLKKSNSSERIIFDTIKFDSKSGRIKTPESLHVEYKEIFQNEFIPKYLKTMAAFSNNDGGKLIFGVSDSPRNIKGVLGNFITDAELNDKCSKYFEPEMNFQIDETEISKTKIYCITVSPARSKPIICKKNATLSKGGKDKTLIEEGAIYYRYSAKSDKIKFIELQKILQEITHNNIQQISENLQIMQSVGLNKTGIVDLSRKESIGEHSNIYVSNETAKELNWIEEGRFTEKDGEGAPAFKVVGTAEISHGIEKEIPQTDRYSPTEVANNLNGIFQASFPQLFSSKKLSPSHLHKIAVGLKLRSKDNSVVKYGFYDDKTSRYFYRGSFVDKIKDILASDPDKILEFLPKTEIDPLS